MIVNGKTLLELSPIVGMASSKQAFGGVTHGLGEAGYDIRIKQRICFGKLGSKRIITYFDPISEHHETRQGRFTLASAMEEFNMPDCLTGIVHDKSSWARRGLSVFNTVIEPGWKGYLTLELMYYGEGSLILPAGSGIAQVIFHRVTDPASYTGRYQHQPNCPTGALHAE